MPTPLRSSSTLDDSVVEKYADDLIELRRDLHAHPELSWAETRTTDVVAERLEAAGIARHPRSRAPGCSPTSATRGPLVALRADLDALPVDDTTGLPWASTTPGVAHACGHDVHTAGLVGAGLALAEAHHRGQLAGPGPAAVPARRGGHAGRCAAADGPRRPRRASTGSSCSTATRRSTSGYVGVRDGALTGAADALSVRLSGRGGHTSRPHLTEDLTFALGKLVVELPAILSRRLDPRAGRRASCGAWCAPAPPTT